MRSPAIVESNNRILIVDDNLAIHDDLRKVLNGEAESSADLLEDESVLLELESFEIESLLSTSWVLFTSNRIQFSSLMNRMLSRPRC